MSDPHAYGSATEKLLYMVAGGTCYYPNCNEPIMVTVAGFPTTNVQIAHIRGAKPGSARYDPRMTDGERARFANLILLCKPHHDLVDKFDAFGHPVELLQQFKEAREAGQAPGEAGRLLTIENLEDALRAVRLAEPQRDVTVELSGAILSSQGWLITPVCGWREILNLNPQTLHGQRATAVVVRNVGALPVQLTSVSLLLRTDGLRGKAGQFTLLGRNDYIGLNPALPHLLGIGCATSWYTKLTTTAEQVRAAQSVGVHFPLLWARVALGSGEQVESSDVRIDELPL